MPKEERKQSYREVRTSRPGDRVLRVRTHERRLDFIMRRPSAAVDAAIKLFTDILNETPIVPVIGLLSVLVVLIPIPIALIERSAADAEVTSYGIGLWWAVSAFTTVGHSDVDLVTVPGRVIGSIFTIVSVAMFFGSVIAAFSSYFMLTWRTPKRQVMDTITYYLQRVDQLSVEEIEELEEITAGVLHTAKAQAEVVQRRRAAEPPEEEATTEEGE